MGNMQYPTKGLLEIDFFRVSKMTTGEHYSVTFKLVCVNNFDDSVSTFAVLII